MIQDLPIYPFLEDICTALKNSPSRFAVLTAETAAGKTTAVPIAMLNHFPGTIIMLEPRRVAAAAAADRISSLLNEQTGGTVGYRIHLDSCVSKKTRIEIVTEGILTRRLQHDPFLEGTSVVILDEFHERSINTDLSLAFLKDSAAARSGLFVLVMSATIDTEKICRFLNAPLIHVPGRTFPVSIEYRCADISQPIEQTCAREAAACIENIDEGAVLVFLPGIAEIQRAVRHFSSFLNADKADYHILHSSVPLHEQRKIVSPPLQKKPRVIFSTTIAETSLTIPDTVCVIDCGLSRFSRYDPRTGMNRLVTERESVFSADQRAGRAGRTRPGRCIRIWPQHDARCSDFPPEIVRSDLMQTVLEYAQWTGRAAEIDESFASSWLDTPPSSLWNSSCDVLKALELLDKSGTVTAKGTAALTLGVHPRIAAVMLAAHTSIREETAFMCARLITAGNSMRELQKNYDDLSRRISKIEPQSSFFTAKNISEVLCRGFPDRVARKTADGKYQIPSGRICALQNTARPSEGNAGSSNTANVSSLPLWLAAGSSNTANASSLPLWLAAVSADAGSAEGRIYEWQPLDEQTAEQFALDRSTVSTDVFIENGKTVKLKTVSYGKILLSSIREIPDARDIQSAMLKAVCTNGTADFPWSDKTQELLRRFVFFADKSGCAGISEDDVHRSLADTASDWLLPFLPADGKLTGEVFSNALQYAFSQVLPETLFTSAGHTAVKRTPPSLQFPSAVPSSITLSNGRQAIVHYEAIPAKTGDTQITPVIEMIIQHIFGCYETPVILGKKVLLRLLSPARRPLQITDDLTGFWQNTWPQICKEMKGRYPKHNWDPLKPLL